MQLNQFRFLIAVDKYGSISKAAQELYISQSTISLSLINLEEELGHVLLNRSKRGVTLTAEGKEVLKRATVIQDAIESLRDISADEETIIGDVRIGGSSHLAMNIITDAMLQLKRQYEGVHVFAQRDDIKTTLKKVAQNELDLAFVHYHALQETLVENDLKRLQLEFHKIYSDALSVCVRENHPLTWQERVTFCRCDALRAGNDESDEGFPHGAAFWREGAGYVDRCADGRAESAQICNADRRSGFSAAR